jgi:hypothetical protein
MARAEETSSGSFGAEENRRRSDNSEWGLGNFPCRAELGRGKENGRGSSREARGGEEGGGPDGARGSRGSTPWRDGADARHA